MANKSPGKREEKKPKKDAKLNVVTKEAPTPMTVEVVQKKHKGKDS